MLESLSRCFDASTARAVSELRQDAFVQRRMEKLGAKATSGRLSPRERDEYEALVEMSDIVATLQLKARRRLAGLQPA